MLWYLHECIVFSCHLSYFRVMYIKLSIYSSFWLLHDFVGTQKHWNLFVLTSLSILPSLKCCSDFPYFSLCSADYPALVVKASGLAAGKGVVVAQSKEEACQAARDMLNVRALVFKIAVFCKIVIRNICCFEFYFLFYKMQSFMMTYQYSQHCRKKSSHESNLVVKLLNYLYYCVE